MISTKQIFIVYHPGMFGTMLANLLDNPTRKLAGPRGTSHNSGYTQIIKNFHNTHHVETILQMDDKQRINFFQPLKYVIDRKCIHTLSSYKFLKIPFHQYFKSFTVVALVPEQDSTHESWASRYVSTMAEYKEGKNQDTISEKLRYLKKDLVYAQKGNYHIRFDPINFFDFDHTQKLITDICVHAKSDRIKIPYQHWSKHMSKAKQFFDNTSK
jgi:hypothetical protein